MFGWFWGQKGLRQGESGRGNPAGGRKESGRGNPESGLSPTFLLDSLFNITTLRVSGIPRFQPPITMTNLETTSGFAGKTHGLESRMKIAHARLGKRHTEETRAKMSANSGRKRPVFVEGVRYESLHSAAVALGLLDQTLMMRIKRNTPGHAYAEF